LDEKIIINYNVGTKLNVGIFCLLKRYQNK